MQPHPLARLGHMSFCVLTFMSTPHKQFMHKLITTLQPTISPHITDAAMQLIMLTHWGVHTHTHTTVQLACNVYGHTDIASHSVHPHTRI